MGFRTAITDHRLALRVKYERGVSYYTARAIVTGAHGKNKRKQREWMQRKMDAERKNAGHMNMARGRAMAAFEARDKTGTKFEGLSWDDLTKSRQRRLIHNQLAYFDALACGLIDHE